MPRRSDHTRAEFRSLVISAAADLVAEQGDAGLSARAIAKRVGYSPGSLYLHFGNLDEVILHVNARTLDRLHAHIETAVQQAGPGAAAVRAAGQAYASFARRHPHPWRLCFEHRLPPDISGPAWLDARIQSLIALLLTPLAEATGRDGDELTRSAQALWAGVHGICMLKSADKLQMVGKADADTLIDTLIDTHLRGLAGA